MNANTKAIQEALSDFRTETNYVRQRRLAKAIRALCDIAGEPLPDIVRIWYIARQPKHPAFRAARGIRYNKARGRHGKWQSEK